jgi:hypothetical protein
VADDQYIPGEESQGAWLAFAGFPAVKVVEMRGAASMSLRDITGIGSPPLTREIVPGEFQPIEISFTAIGRPQFERDGLVAPLTISFGGETVTFDRAFVNNVQWAATVGAKLRTQISFVAYNSLI